MSKTSRTRTAAISASSGASTCSPASAAGPTLFDSLDGGTTCPCGPGAHLVSPSVPPASAKAKPTIDTSGPCSFGSSASAALQFSLASKLRALTDTDGSPECVMTWKRRAMLSGAPICRLAARARRSSDKGYGLWPAPDSSHHGSYSDSEKSLARIGAKRMANLDDVANLVVWAAPTASLADKGIRTEAGAIKEAMRSHGPDLAAMASLACWNAPTANDAKQAQAQAADRNLSGQATKLRSASTAKRGVLNPALPRWLRS